MHIKVGNVSLGHIEHEGRAAYRPVSGYLPRDFFPTMRTRAEAAHTLLAAYAVIIGHSLIFKSANSEIERVIEYWNLRKPETRA